jgi:hypothetical protein
MEDDERSDENETSNKDPVNDMAAWLNTWRIPRIGDGWN